MSLPPASIVLDTEQEQMTLEQYIKLSSGSSNSSSNSTGPAAPTSSNTVTNSFANSNQEGGEEVDVGEEGEESQ